MKASTALKPLVIAMSAALAVSAHAGEKPQLNLNGEIAEKVVKIILQAGDANATIDSDQNLSGNFVDNKGTENTAELGDSLNSSDGNLGANVAAGDLNQQANQVAIATSDEDFVFGSAFATTNIDQNNRNNGVSNFGGANTAGVYDSGNNASGNAGINVAAGALNQQSNALAIATARGWDTTATSNGDQSLSGVEVANNAGESVFRESVEFEESANQAYSLDSSRSIERQTSASAERTESKYRDTDLAFDKSKSSYSDRAFSRSHASDTTTESSASEDRSLTVSRGGAISGEFSSTPNSVSGQGSIEKTRSFEYEANNRTSDSYATSESGEASRERSAGVELSASLSYRNDEGASYTERSELSDREDESVSIREAASSDLAESVTYTTSYAFVNPVTNSATLSDSLNNTSGNIGVNLAAGSNNQQLNTLTIAVGGDQ